MSADLSDFEFTELSKKVETEIETVSGVSRVETRGVRDREITVIVDQKALLRYEVSLNEVISALRNTNLTFPIGQIVNNGVSYNVAFEGDIENSSAVKDVPVVSRGGQPVYVKDIATVEDGLSSAMTLSRLSFDGEPSESSIQLSVYKQSGGDITTITGDVNTKIKELQQPNELLDGINSVTILDAGSDIKKDLIRLSSSGLQTVILVILLLVVTIGWREGLLAGLAIPLSFLFGFIGLYFSGNTINFLSLFSLILGIGILVDSAIVMVEGISRKITTNTMTRQEAAISTIREFSTPLISGTLTTVSMFVGLFIVTGVIGQFISSIPFTLIFLLFASLFVALTILPLLASLFLRRRHTSAFEKKQVTYTHKLENWYKTTLQSYLDNEEKQNKFLSILVSALALSVFLPINVFAGLLAAPLVYVITNKTYTLQANKGFSELKRKLIWLPVTVVGIVVVTISANAILPQINVVEVIFFDQSDVDFVIVELEQPEGTVKEVTDVGVRRVEEILYQEEEIESFSTTVGSGSEFGSGGTGEKFANIFITLRDDRLRTSTEVVDDLRAAFTTVSDLTVTVNQPSDGPPTGAAIIIKFLGDDLNQITELVNQSAAILRDIPNIINVETSTNNNNTEFVLELDKDKAAALGLTSFEISQLARTALYGTEATSLTTLAEDIEVIVKLNIDNNDQPVADSTNQVTIDALERLLIPTQNGTVPLSSVVTISLRESSSVINHEDGKRIVSVTADVSGSGNARELQAEALNQIRESLSIPDDVTLSTGGGETDESNKAFVEMFLALIVGITLMVGILTLQFNSYLHMRYVLSILPYSIIGIMFGLAITQNTLSFPSMMGFIALSGIVVNNSILLIDMMNNMRKQRPTDPIKDIVLDAASNRLRPILLTTITTVIGMIPLTYAGDLWSPLAYAVMFGLVFSVIITLVLIPITYLKNPGELSK